MTEPITSSPMTPPPAKPTIAPEPLTYHDTLDYDTTRKQMFGGVLNAMQTRYPIENDKYRLELNDIRYEGPEHFTLAEQKQAILKRKSLYRPIKGTWQLTDRTTNQPVDTFKSVIAHVPYITQRGTYIVNGSEYTVASQLRLKSGVYTRKKDNGELESHFNVLKGGPSFRISMEPSTGIFRMNVGQAKLKLYPILRAMGKSDKDIQNSWGPALFNANMAGKDDGTLEKTWERLADSRAKKEVGENGERDFTKLFAKMELDPNVTKHTLGEAHKVITPETILRSTHKILNVAKGTEDTDDRDSMAYQETWNAPDLLKERIQKDAGRLGSRLLWRATLRGNLSGLPSAALNPQIESLFYKSGVAQPLEEVSPLDPMDQNVRVTRMGEGGMSADAIPEDSRSVQPSHFGFIDPVRSPESGAVGVDLRLATDTYRGTDKQLYSKMRNVQTGRLQFINPTQAIDSVIAFPGELAKARAEGRKNVRAMAGGKLSYVPASKVQYEAASPQGMFSHTSNLVPMAQGMKPGRLLMAASHSRQALPLEDPEAPLVQSAGEDGKSYYDKLGNHMGIARSTTGGTVVAVAPDNITVRDLKGQVQTHDIYNNFPLNRKTMLNSTAIVKPGDVVQPGQLIAHSNFTNKNGTLATGKNLRVAYMPWKSNYEDAIAISESAAHKLKSEHMYTEKIDKEDFTTVDHAKFLSLFPSVYNKAQLSKIGTDGLAKPGTIVHKNDPLILAVNERTSKGASMLHGGGGNWKDSSTKWEHDTPGIVTDVWDDEDGVKMAIKTYAHCQVGDKLAGRHANKGVIGSIIPDHQMPHSADGKPFEVLMNPLGLISRINPSQAFETVLGKIAEKRGVPYMLKSFEPGDLAEMTQNEMKKHDVSDTEDVIDPSTGRVIPKVLTGKQYIMKLHHTAESKGSTRALGAYSSEGVPAAGDEENPKRIGLGEMQALISHGATQNIQEIKTIKGTRNDDYWQALTLGLTPPSPEVPAAYKKFLSLMKAAGINVKKKGEHLHLTAMTDKDVDAMSSGEIKDPTTVKWLTTYGRGLKGEKALDPVEGGLFDRGITGGHGGNRWGHIVVAEPIPQPAMADPIRRLLNLTNKDYEAVIAGQKELPNLGTGGKAIKAALQRIQIEPEIDRQKEIVKTAATGALRDDAIKKLKYLQTFQRTEMKPEDMVITKVPVLPPQFRPITANANFEMVAGSNLLYMDLMNANKNFKELSQVTSGDAVNEARLNVYHALKAVTGLGDPIKPDRVQQGIKGVLHEVFGSSPKNGLVQRKLLGTAVDMSARAAITPNPDLDIDHIGIPEDQAWKLYGPFVTRRLIRQMGNQPDARAAAIRMVVNRDKTALEAMQAEMEVRPVMTSRAPALHKYSIMAFHPVLTKAKTLQLSPAVTPGFGADFDGDEQINTVLVKISVDALAQYNIQYGKQYMEARRMSARVGIKLPVKSGKNVFVFNLEDFPHGDLIKTKEGENGRIDFHAVSAGTQVMAYDEKSHKVIWADVSGWSKHYDREIVTVELQSGRQILTDDDPRAVYGVAAGTLTPARFTPSEALEAKVLVPRAIEITCDETETAVDTNTNKAKHATKYVMPDSVLLSAEAGYYFGAMCGDGWVTHSKGEIKNVSIAGISDEIMAKFEQCLAQVAGQLVRRGDTESLLSYGESRRSVYTSVDLAKFTEPMIGSGADNKHLPPFYLSAPLAFRQGLLSGLIDTDGSIFVAHVKGKKPQVMGSFQSNSLRMVHETQLLAMSMGIRSRVCPSKTPAGKPCWVLSFSNQDLHKIVGVVHVDKVAAQKQAPVIASPAAVRHDLVPISFSLVNQLVKWIGAPRETSKEHRALYTNTQLAKKTGYMTRVQARLLVRQLINRLPEHADGLTWKAIVADTSVTWDPIKTIEVTGIRETGFDLTVPGYETFMAVDGVILSNTMNFHVLVTDKAIAEAKEKMMPSKNLRAVKDFAPLWMPRHEFQHGLYLASTKRSGRKMLPQFGHERDVTAGFAQGKLSIEDIVNIKDKM